MSSNTRARLDENVVHVDEQSTTGDLLRGSRRELTITLLVAAFLAACFAASKPNELADVPQRVTFQQSGGLNVATPGVASTEVLVDPAAAAPAPGAFTSDPAASDDAVGTRSPDGTTQTIDDAGTPTVVAAV